MTTTQPRSLGRTSSGSLTTDDVVRHPRTRRFVRIHSTSVLRGMNALTVSDLETGEVDYTAFPLSSRPTVYVA